ncbi:uncharacterized protein LOC129968913 isoform X2 [Argiope bruennichi]|uniref:uncharacterized protein LOC129968913 isoform X2 n=1 Tax=Argiope bruennichi TaxID=94029 RepID=UPI002494A80F|nr:uncharacterized protein LOC129968913 isoform X2 [Argiope bruennichi]
MINYCLFLHIFLHSIIHVSESVNHEIFASGKLRHLLADAKHLNRTHNSTKDAKTTPNPLKEDDSVGTEAAVLFIVVIVVLSVIGMVIYFIRKFDQLNRSLPTYRYSSLKTEINGYGPDDKNESQALVSVSTEEEDDYDEEEQDLEVSPPTLLVRSQTVMPSKAVNGSLPMVQDGKLVTSGSLPKSGESSVDSDDELLQ